MILVPFQRILGSGSSIRFWYDSWVGGNPLSTRFLRLFALDCRKEDSIAVKAYSEGESSSWQWSWRHEPRGRQAGELVEFLQVVRQPPPPRSVNDGWIWSWAADGYYSTKILRTALDNAASDLCLIKTVWSPLIPKQVNIFVWRAQRS